MTDEQLIAEALKIQQKGCIYFGEVAELTEQATSKEAMSFIHNIAVSMYHREEAMCGLL